MVPGAAVVCRNTETDMRSSMLTNAEGLFRFATLPVGSYEITVEKQGFERLLRSGIVLLTGQTLDLSLTLNTGPVNQTAPPAEIGILNGSARSASGAINQGRRPISSARPTTTASPTAPRTTASSGCL